MKIVEAIKKAKENSGEKNFTQSIDLIINLKNLDTKKSESKIEEYIVLPHGSSRKSKICALVGAELKADAEQICDVAVFDKDFPKLDKRKIRKIARECDFFLAQANIMTEIAKTFGKFLAPLGKMPNPKAGQIVPPKINLKPIVEKFQNTVIFRIKKSPVLQASIGNEKMKDEDLVENAKMALEVVEHALPQGKNNIKEVIVKTTMGKPCTMDL